MSDEEEKQKRSKAPAIGAGVGAAAGFAALFHPFGLFAAGAAHSGGIAGSTILKWLGVGGAGAAGGAAGVAIDKLSEPKPVEISIIDKNRKVTSDMADKANTQALKLEALKGGKVTHGMHIKELAVDAGVGIAAAETVELIENHKAKAKAARENAAAQHEADLAINKATYAHEQLLHEKNLAAKREAITGSQTAQDTAKAAVIPATAAAVTANDKDKVQKAATTDDTATPATEKNGEAGEKKNADAKKAEETTATVNAEAGKKDVVGAKKTAVEKKEAAQMENTPVNSLAPASNAVGSNTPEKTANNLTKTDNDLSSLVSSSHNTTPTDISSTTKDDHTSLVSSSHNTTPTNLTTSDTEHTSLVSSLNTTPTDISSTTSDEHTSLVSSLNTMPMDLSSRTADEHTSLVSSLNTSPTNFTFSVGNINYTGGDYTAGDRVTAGHDQVAGDVVKDGVLVRDAAVDSFKDQSDTLQSNPNLSVSSLGVSNTTTTGKKNNVSPAPTEAQIQKGAANIVQKFEELLRKEAESLAGAGRGGKNR